MNISKYNNQTDEPLSDLFAEEDDEEEIRLEQAQWNA